MNIVEQAVPVLSDRVTTVVAAAAVGTPLWLPSIQQVSTHAALWMPILGVTWLIVQIIAKIIELRKGK